MKTFQVFLVFISVGWQQLNAAPETFSRGFATVTVQELEKRSLDQQGASYQVRVAAMGEEHNLNLETPTSSIFTPDFQYMEISTDSETEELQFNDATPSQEELKSIEGNFYTDRQSNAAVSLKKSPESDSFQLNGRINDYVAIRANDEKDVHEVVRNSEDEKPSGNDYVDLQRTLTTGKQSRSTSYATPEVLVIFDYANTQTFKRDRNQIIDYLGVFFHAINNRYATASDPVISFKLSGVTSVTSLSAQPYMENNRAPNGYDINKVLTDLSRWANQNARSTPRYDLIALITGTDMQMKDSSGNWEPAVAGLAYLKAACWNTTDRYLGSSVTEDIGGFYSGMFSVAHELAHNMGAPHDGNEKDGTDACPWSDGYIMSYEGWGTKSKFYFSDCSLQLMKNLIDSKEGTCTRTTQASSNIPLSSDNIGDRYSMKQLCVKYTNSTEAVPDPDTSADSLCKNLKCRYPIPNKPGWYSIKTLNHPPGDDTPCGTNMKCVDGDCV